MNPESVVLFVNRLYNNYNPETSQKIREDKINFLNQELKSYESWQLQKACDGITSDENIKKFPTIAQIKNYLPRKAKELYQDCDRCRCGVTYVWIFKQDFGRDYEYAFACPFCEAGRNAGTGIPVLPQEYHSIPYEKLRERKAL